MSRRVICAAIVSVAAMIAIPASASAGTISTDGATVTFTGGPGESNDAYTGLTTLYDQQDNEYPAISVTDSNASVTTTDPNCFAEDNQGACVYLGLTSIVLNGGDQNDELRLTPLAGTTGNRMDGGDGDDKLTSAYSGADIAINGGPGDDTLFPGPDNGSGTPSHDTVSGGIGNDLVQYECCRDGSTISVSIDGVANDGFTSERDNILDAERVQVTHNGDVTLIGSDASEELKAFGQDDTLIGNGGNDSLYGYNGNDTLDGGPGKDFLEGGTDDDTIVGGSGFDSFVGDEVGGNNQIITGNDTIDAYDGVGKEPISCGPGTDSVIGDKTDKVTTDPQNGCEETDLRKGSPPIPGVKVSVPKSVKVGNGGLKIKAKVTSKNVALKATLSGKVKISGGGSVKLSSAKGKVKAGKKATLSAKLPKSKAAQVAKAVKQGKRTTANLVIKLVSDGQVSTDTRVVAVK